MPSAAPPALQASRPRRAASPRSSSPFPSMPTVGELRLLYSCLASLLEHGRCTRAQMGVAVRARRARCAPSACLPTLACPSSPTAHRHPERERQGQGIGQGQSDYDQGDRAPQVGVVAGAGAPPGTRGASWMGTQVGLRADRAPRPSRRQLRPRAPANLSLPTYPCQLLLCCNPAWPAALMIWSGWWRRRSATRRRWAAAATLFTCPAWSARDRLVETRAG